MTTDKTTNMSPSKKKAPASPKKTKNKTASTIIPPPVVFPNITHEVGETTTFLFPGDDLSKTMLFELTSDEVAEVRKLLQKQTLAASTTPADASSSSTDEEEVDPDEVDLFMVETENFLGAAVKEVILPKFLKSTQRVEEKSNLYLALDGEPKVYAQLLKLVASDTPLKPLIIKLYEPNEAETELVVAVTYEFPTPTLLAIDFGNLSHSREKPREIRIEFNFNHFKIDNVDFYC